MRLPNAERAVIGREKIADYLLNPAHPDNGGKAAFFLALGYKRDDWPPLAEVLRRLALATDVTKSMETAHGIKYILVGGMVTPGGKTPARQTHLDFPSNSWYIRAVKEIKATDFTDRI